MMERRRGPGRPAYDSKQKLVAAACSLLAERGFEATSPQMFQQRSGVGHGSMYHHFPGKGKEGLALDAISHMRASTLAFLDGSPTPNGAEVEEVRASIVAALDRLLAFSEQVSGDPAVNALARRRVGSPVELPVGLAIGALSIVFCISRLLVASSKLGASIIATAIGAVVVAAAFYLSSKPKISRSTMVVAVTLLSVGVLAAGIGGAIAGPAELPHEESTSAEHGAMGAPGQSDVTAISSMAIG